MSTEHTPRVAICVATYLRPMGLERLLRGIDGLVFTGPAPALEIVVIDNDPDGSARAVCESLRASVRWPIRYEHEPQRGISFARNRAVAAALGRADYIAFIDDDEAPDPRWMDELLRVQRAYEADVVGGPVARRFEAPPPHWVVKGRFFEDRRYATGTAVRDPATNNVLIRVAALERVSPPFDPRFAVSGGEDTHLFLRLWKAGTRMVWADEAVVVEWVPSSRARLGWLLRRVYRTSNTWSRCEHELFPSPRVTAARIAKAGARVGIGLALLPFSWMLGRHRAVQALWLVAIGVGHLTGLAGVTYEEYLVIHGS